MRSRDWNKRIVFLRMSVLITPLPDGDALIMTMTLTVFLRYVQVITTETEGSHIVLFWKARKEKIFLDQLFEVREQLLELGLGENHVSGENFSSFFNFHFTC